MRYVMARVDNDERDMTYRIYVTDSLKIIGGLDTRYADMIRKQPVETRTANEIITHIKDQINSLE